MLTVRVLNVAEVEAERVLEPSVTPAAFARPQDPPGPRAYALWAGSAETLAAWNATVGEAVGAGALAAAIAGWSADAGGPVRPAGEPAYDLTFIAPASVSWVWAQGDGQLRRDLEQAVLNAASRCVDHLVRTRPLADGEEPGRGWAAALGLHVIGTPQPWTKAPPPQLHVHACLVAVLDADQQLRGPDRGALYESSLTREGGALGRAALAEDLRELGFDLTLDTGPGARGYEITGVPEGLLLSGQSADKGCAGLGEETDDPRGGFHR
ncbi:relaxase domain-containing protein [Actinacidiphila paucisporea]|uniref:TrwC relaxase n=1 Tax=Actinacidiphila paucisporea TaxID=310782 RepID=A0A1M7QXH5_9ACTN|nr:relaxase domain-containing protein [Actinacidiphila paucisporea]SHN36789.1 TrwC relaxase [Actinacidiphila paucisporea]